MPNTYTSFLRPVNERDTLGCDLDNSWFGNKQSQGVLSNIYQEHCDVAKNTTSMSGYPNNAPICVTSYTQPQSLVEPLIDTDNTMDPTSFQGDGRFQTGFKSNCFDKNVFDTECPSISLSMNIDPIPVPNDVRMINNKVLSFDINPIPVPDDQVYILETSTTRKHSLANHSYIDFSRVEDEKVMKLSSLKGEKLEAIITFGGAMHPSHIVTINDVNPEDKGKSTPQNRITFPTKLMSLLDNNSDPNVFTWLSHGRAFIVKDNTRFMNELCPSLCKSNNFKSFQRMLNLWGFKRITGNRDKGSYYHQMFLRGMPNLVKKMSLCKNKRGGWPLSNPASEPDFYKLSELRPLLND